MYNAGMTLLLLAALACTGPEYHRLDFWLGEWDVASPSGKPEGHNVISRAQDGCAIREQWTDADGSTGESLFYVDKGRWKQVWVTSDGGMKEKSEQPVEDGIRFAGAIDRTTLTKLDGGRVRQLIERPSDGAKWEGIYTPRKPACDRRDFDFWIGDWDLTIRARPAPDKPWVTARGTNRIWSSHAGCVIEEHFHADGPQEPWNGHSDSVFANGAWRQTWVDDQGEYLVFTGGMDAGRMVLVGEAQGSVRKRMVFSDMARDSLKWTWERTDDGGKTWTPMMTIDYRRHGS